MLVIRLARTGRKKYPTYRIVAADSRRAATGKFVMILGHYNPHTKELVIKKEEVTKFIGNGAQPSNSVIKLLQKEKVKLPDWAELKTRQRPPKKAEPAVEAKASQPEAEASAEAETAAVAQTAEAEVQKLEDKAEVKDKAETAADNEARGAAAEAASTAGAEAAAATSDEASQKPAE
jgi:small subunit ribosomal protein S16